MESYGVVLASAMVGVGILMLAGGAVRKLVVSRRRLAAMADDEARPSA